MSFCPACYDLDGRNKQQRKNDAIPRESNIINFDISLQTLKRRKAEGCPSCSMLFDGIQHDRECRLGVEEEDISISVRKCPTTPLNVSINRLESLHGSKSKFSHMLVHLEFF
jgi:hypothetical protein